MATQISKYFTLEQLTATSTGQPNVPDPTSLQNLTNLANNLLDPIYDQIGPFTITSAFRSPQVNAAIQGSGAPASSTSYHMQGLAADLLPSTMTPFNFFLALLGSSFFTNGQIGELINEVNETGIVHVSLPTATKVSDAMYLLNGSYYKYTQDEITTMLNYGQQVAPETTDAVDTTNVYEDDQSFAPSTVIFVGIAAFLLVSAVMSARIAT